MNLQVEHQPVNINVMIALTVSPMQTDTHLGKLLGLARNVVPKTLKVGQQEDRQVLFVKTVVMTKLPKLTTQPTIESIQIRGVPKHEN